MSCEHLRSAIGAYALGALDPDEAAAVRRHLETCAECAAEYDALAPLPGLLSLAGGAEEAVEKPLSPAFEERLLDAFARDRAASPRRRLRWRVPRRRWLAAGAVTAAAAVAAVVVGVTLLGQDEPSPSYGVTFRNVGGPANASARANLESSEEGTRVHLSVRGLPRDPDAVYEVLCDAEEWTATAGTFRTDAKGHAYVVVTTALRRSEYNAIRIVRRGHRADGRLYKRDVLTARLS
jgi:predicted anti-sigma-YlaC factor YlaD